MHSIGSAAETYLCQGRPVKFSEKTECAVRVCFLFVKTSAKKNV